MVRNIQKHMVVDYSRGKIYKIVSLEGNCCYIGSTCEPTIARRLAAHKRNYNNWTKGKYHFVSVYAVLDYEDARIVLIENFPCESRQELLKREFEIMSSIECVNKTKPYTGLNKKEYDAKYRAENIEKIRLREKKTHALYREKNLEKIRQYDAERRNIKIQCSCGGTYVKQYKKRHEKSLLHQSSL